MKNFTRFQKTCGAMVLCLLVAACAKPEVIKSGNSALSMEDKASIKRAYEHDMLEASKAGYREGVKQGAAAAGAMHGGYVWRPYKIEPIDVPGRVVNGIMYPAHQEEVIVRPTRIDRVYDSDTSQRADGKGE